jgi:hypothetical protein
MDARLLGKPSRYAVWAWHKDVGKWMCLVEDMAGQDAAVEVTTRQDRLRREGGEARIVALPVGEDPARRWPRG